MIPGTSFLRLFHLLPLLLGILKFQCSLAQPEFSKKPFEIDSLLTLLAQDKSDTVYVYNKISKYYLERSPSKTKYYANKALNISLISNNKQGEANALRHLGFVNWIQGYFDSAFYYYRKAIHIYDQLELLNEYANGIGKIGMVFYWQDDYDSAIHYLKKSMTLYRQLGDTLGLSYILDNLGHVYDRKGEFEISYKYFFEGLKFQEKVDRLFDHRSSQFRIGSMKYNQYFNEKMIAKDQSNYDLSKLKKDTVAIIESLKKLGNRFILLEKHDQALLAFNELLTLARSQSDTSGEWKSLIKIGVSYYNLKDYERSIQCYKKAAVLQEKQAWWLKQAWSYVLIGNSYYNMMNYDSAVSYYQKSIEINEYFNYRLAVVRASLKVTKCYLDQKRFRHALHFSLKSAGLSQKLSAKNFEKESLKLVALSYAGLKQYEKAYQTNLQYNALNDSIQYKSNAKKILQYQAQYESDKKDKEISLLNEIKFLQDEKIDRTNLLLMVLSLGSVIILTLAMLLYSKYKIIKKSDREKELLLGEIHHRVKNNLQVISSLLKLQSGQLRDKQAKHAVLEGRDRVKAMALIHQRLYQQDRFSAIEMHDYILSLVENLAQSYGYDQDDFELKLEVAQLYLDVDSAIPLGLIINELVSNSFTHAFNKGEKNDLFISLKAGTKEINLQVTDNGPGIANIDSERDSSFGLQLIEALTEELKGTMLFENHSGTSVKLNIKEFKLL